MYFGILFQISFKFVTDGPIDDKQALIQVSACCQRCPKPLPEPMMTNIHDFM